MSARLHSSVRPSVRRPPSIRPPSVPQSVCLRSTVFQSVHRLRSSPEFVIPAALQGPAMADKIKIWETLLAVPPERYPWRSRRASKWTSSCRTVVPRAGSRPRRGPNPAELDQHLVECGQHWPTLANMCAPMFVSIRWTLAKCWANLAKLCRVGPWFRRARAKQANI